VQSIWLTTTNNC